jgi:hypothetical protein
MGKTIKKQNKLHNFRYNLPVIANIQRAYDYNQHGQNHQKIEQTAHFPIQVAIQLQICIDRMILLPPA